MIQLTKVISGNDSNPNLFLIPGGPGLSSMTLRSLDILSRSFNLFYVDFPGTNENAYTGDRKFEELSDELGKLITEIDGKNFVFGHSFGGFFAADILIKNKCDGIICVSTPFSEEALMSANENYEKFATKELKVAEAEWGKKQNDKNFARWLSEYGELYFTNTNGKELILNDKVSAQFFMDNREEASHFEIMLSKMANISKKKIFIAGSEDKLLTSEFLEQDAKWGKFNFVKIKDASHFVMFDQPGKVAEYIEEKI